MTQRLAPGSPPLDTGEPVPAGPVSDSEWDGLDEESPEQATQDNLGRLARQIAGKRGSSTKG
jgi:hypothetical protein